MKPEQCRAARALIGWSQEDLEAEAGASKKTIADFERGARSPHARTLASLQAALERAGVVFLPEGNQGPGVRLERPRLQLVNVNENKHRQWVAFAVRRGEDRILAFASFDALPAGVAHEAGFGRYRDRFMWIAADMADAGGAWPEPKIIIDREEFERAVSKDGPQAS